MLNINKKIPDKFSKAFKRIDYKDLTVSLSGGSDSMICAYILKKLGYNVSALMINYNNRDSCDDEVKMVSLWCNKMDIPLYVRKINEISRSRDCDRAFYEDITKKIRFDSYLFLGNPVVLGHNEDDCFENIITNIGKSRSYDNLLGMVFKLSQFCDKHILDLYRPMLEICKANIVALANDHNIPYLYDSTPKWSDRGKIRDILKVALNNYDLKLIPNLIDMAKRYRDIFSTFSDLLMKNTSIDKVDNNSLRIYYVECYLIDYWKDIFMQLHDKFGYNAPSKKSLLNFIQKITN